MKNSKIISLSLALSLLASPFSYGQQAPEPRDPDQTKQTPPKPRKPHTPPEPQIPGPPEPHQPGTPPEPHIPNAPPEPHQPGTPPEPHVPSTPPSADLSRVRLVAREQGNMMANRVVAVYGEAERELYSFYVGLIEGINLYNFSHGSVEHNADYLAAQRRGSQEGQSSGYSRGQQEGLQDGNTQGSSDAAGRFVSVIDQNVNPNVVEPQVQAPVKQFTVSRPPVKSLEERLNDKNSQFFAILNRHSYSYEDYAAGNIFDGNVITLWQLYQMGGTFRFNRFIDSYARADWAWEAWIDRTLGGRYSNALQYYREISDPNQTSNSQEARRVFIQEFKAQYDSEISSKWNNAVRRIDPLMRNEGLMLGTQVAREYVEDLGYDQGYRDEYSNEAQRSYPQSFHQAFSTQFNSTVSFYQSHAVASGLNVSLEPANGVYLPGTSVGLNVLAAANAGRVDGTLRVTVSSSGLKFVAPGSLVLSAGKSLSHPVVLPQLAEVSMSITPDVDQPVIVDIGDSHVSMTFKVLFWDVITALGNSNDNQSASLLTDYIRGQLAVEWTNGKVSGYSKSKTLLEQLVKAFNAATPSQRARIAQARENLRSAYGAEPGMFSGKRGDWKAAQALLDHLR